MTVVEHRKQQTTIEDNLDQMQDNIKEIALIPHITTNSMIMEDPKNTKDVIIITQTNSITTRVIMTISIMIDIQTARTMKILHSILEIAKSIKSTKNNGKSNTNRIER